MKRTKILKISGKVQGVYFRESLKKEAQRLGITGWVRNRRDGTVEALVQGEESPVREIIAWCHQGPPAAEVKEVLETDANHDSALAEFLRKETD